MEDDNYVPNSTAQTNMSDDDYEHMIDAVKELEELKRTKLFLEAENNRLKAQANNLTGELDGIDIAISSAQAYTCLLYTSPSPRDGLLSRMPSSA